MKILAVNVFSIVGLMAIESVETDVDVHGLDRNHVIPNMGIVTARGVWFPLNY